MVTNKFAARPVLPRHDSEEEELSDHIEEDSSAQSDEEASQEDSEDESTNSHDEDGSESDVFDDEEEEEEEEEDPAPNLSDISFGALAKAQESFTPKSRKRKLSDTLDGDSVLGKEHKPFEGVPIRDPNAPKQSISRTSKHAPAVQSSRNPVSRRREIFEASPALKSRDPRFDATVTSGSRNPSSSDKADRNYSFLTTYQATEILELKTRIKKTKDANLAASLKRQVMSIEAKIRNAETRQKEREILRKHKDEERAAISQGKKATPYYLKQSELKKQVQQDRLDAMGKKARDKMEKRKQKRDKGKDARDMPRARRYQEQTSG